MIKLKWILAVILLCGTLEPIEAKVKEGKGQIKEKKPKKHNLGCSCGDRPPNRPKFWFWFNWK